MISKEDNSQLKEMVRFIVISVQRHMNIQMKLRNLIHIIAYNAITRCVNHAVQHTSIKSSKSFKKIQSSLLMVKLRRK